MGAPAESMLMADLNQLSYPVVAVVIAVVAVVVAIFLRQGTPKERKEDVDKTSPLVEKPKTYELDINIKECKEDFDKACPPAPLEQKATTEPNTILPKLTRSSSGDQKPSEKFDEQKALAELARSNPDKYMKYLMTHLDALNGKNIESTVERIFKEFDKDGNGVLTGNEYDKCVQKLAEHMLGEYEEHGEKLFEYLSREWGMSEEEIDPIRSEYKEKGTIETCKNKVIELVDVDGDGEITLQEAMDGFHKVVDEIELPK